MQKIGNAMRLILKIFIGLALLILFGCTPEVPKGTLRIDTIPTDVPLTINGNFVGNSSSGVGQYFAIELPEGDHNITALVVIDKEKQLFIDKSIFVAPDTLQTITLKLEERLTGFGEQEKSRREAEAAEKKRLAEIEAKRQEAIKAEKRRKEAEKLKALRVKNKPYSDYLNAQKIYVGKNRQAGASIIEYKVDGCMIKVNIDNFDYVQNFSVNATSLDATKSANVENSKFYFVGSSLFGGEYAGERETVQYKLVCKGANKCIKPDDTRDSNTNNRMSVTVDHIDKANYAAEVNAALVNVIKNCQ